MASIQQIPVFVASGNKVKLQSVKDLESKTNLSLDVQSVPVELQSLTHLEILQLAQSIAAYLSAKDFADLISLLNKVKTVRDEPEDDEVRLCMIFRLAVIESRASLAQSQNSVFVAAESGIRGKDLISWVGIRYKSYEYVKVSPLTIPLAQTVIDEVHKNDNRITTGEVVHALYPHLSAATWHPYGPSIVRGDDPLVAEGITRPEQITDALLAGFVQLKKYL